jgi:transglutaminase-like putative cysteine protease
VRASIWNLAAAVALAGLMGGGVGSARAAESMRQIAKTDIRILPDLTVVETFHQEVTPLVETAVRGAAQTNWTVSGNQTFEIVEAYTRKADGRQVPADPKDFVTQAGSVGATMSYVDLKVQQIPYRDVSVGDTTVLTVRITEKEHYIPDHYSRSIVLTPGPVRKTLDVTLRTPASLAIHHDEQQLAYDEQRQGDEIVRHWSGAAAPVEIDEKNIADLAFAVPALRISTFAGFEDIATAYYARAREKAAVTPEVQKLADQITEGKTDTQAQAQALYEWVTRNIRYVAVYFGSGRFVPNDTATILSRRFGDCKDDATLLTALLAAKGIAAEEVLLGTVPTYRLAKTATVSAFNHAIVYIPALDRYVDPTAAFGNFNRLPASDSGKPVVRVSDKGAVVARTPDSAMEDNVVELDSRMTVARDGARAGETTIAARGDFADTVRGYVAQIESRGKDTVLQALAQQRGVAGGTYDLAAPPWTDAHEPYRITIKWTLPKPAGAAAQQAQGRFRAPPGFSPVLPHPAYFFGAIGANKRTYPSVCRPGRMVHTVHVTLTDDVVSVKLPPPIKKITPQFTYRDEWTRDGHELRRRTEVTALVNERVCSPDAIDAVAVAVRSIGTATSPTIYSHRNGTPTAAQPTPLQQLFGNHGAAAPAPAGTAPASGHAPAPVSR